jgi:hypothetical protein
MAICEQCPHYNKKTTQCGICGCFMPLKTKLPHAECPLGKWTATAPQPNINRKDGGGAI